MNKTARELLQGQQLVWVRPDDLVDTALQAMVKHDLTAVPVVEAGESTSAAHSVSGGMLLSAFSSERQGHKSAR